MKLLQQYNIIIKLMMSDFTLSLLLLMTFEITVKCCAWLAHVAVVGYLEETPLDQAYLQRTSTINIRRIQPLTKLHAHLTLPTSTSVASRP